MSIVLGRFWMYTSVMATVQRNFLLPTEQAEWLRSHSFSVRRSQAEIVREALADYRARAERAPESESRDGNRALADRFADGRGIDLDLLRDREEMWSPDA